MKLSNYLLRWKTHTKKNFWKTCQITNMTLEKNSLNGRVNSKKPLLFFKKFSDWSKVLIYKHVVKDYYMFLSCFVMLLFHIFIVFVVDVCYMLTILQKLASVNWICFDVVCPYFCWSMFVIVCREREIKIINSVIYKQTQLTTSKLTLT